MRNRLWTTCVAVLCLLFVRAIPASAQNITSADEYDLSAAVVYDPVLNERSASSNIGFHADVAKRFLEGAKMSAAGVGEIGFNHFEDYTLSSLSRRAFDSRAAPSSSLRRSSNCCSAPSTAAARPT